MAGNWTPYQRNEETGVRYWAIPGTEGFMHRIGGLEKSNETGAISTEPENHNKMVHLRQAKVDKIADYIPELEVLGDKDADLLIVRLGWYLRPSPSGYGLYARTWKESGFRPLPIHQPATEEHG